MTYWRSIVQLRNESTQEGRRERVLDGVKESRGNGLLLFLLLGLTTYIVLVLVVNIATRFFA